MGDVIDGYMHCGLSKYQPIENVKAMMEAAGVTRAVLVQHIGEYDNSYISRIVKDDPKHFAGVCMVNEKIVDRCQALRRLYRDHYFKGIRISMAMNEATLTLLSEALELGLIVLIYAHEGIATFVKVLTGLLETRPDARIVLTHMGNPSLTNDPMFRMHRKIFRLAQYPNVYFQVSGMKMFSPYPHEILYDLIAEAFDRFGSSRLYWGSNYPVVGTQRHYVEDLRLLLDGRLPIPKHAVDAVAGGNARQLWFTESL